MRIAFLVDAFPVITETFIVNQITGLIDRGHDVDVFARGRHSDPRVHPDIERYGLLTRTYYLDDPHHDEKQPRRVRMRAALKLLASPAWLRPAGVRLLTRLATRRGNTAPFNTLGLLTIASRELIHGHYDILHCQYATLGRSSLIMRALGVCHGALVTSLRGHDVTQNDKQVAGYYQGLFDAGDLFLPVSRSLQERVLTMGCPAERTRVHHSGIDIDQFQWRPRTRRPGETTVVISVARMVEMKGLAYGIEAIAAMIAAGLDVHYHIAGAGPLRDSLTALVEQFGIADRVTMHGATPHDEVVRLLDAAHMMLAPSVTAANGEAEGIPNAVKEGMAMGLPIVATRHSGIPELVTDGVSGYLVPERDAAALAAALIRLHGQPERWAEFGRAGRAHIEKAFGRLALNDELVELYRQAKTNARRG